MRILTRALPAALVFTLTSVVGPVAEAAPITYTGCISSVSSECTGDMQTSNWPYAHLSWVVSQPTTSDPWTYTYTFTRSTATGRGNPSLGHSIIEVSTSFAPDDLLISSSCTSALLGTYDSSQGNSNPSMPGPMYGLQCGGSTANPYSWTLITFRAPVWGDFYAKGGSSSAAWNAGFLAADPLGPPQNGSLDDHILRPDTATASVSEPAMLLLFGSGLALAARRMRRAR